LTLVSPFVFFFTIVWLIAFGYPSLEFVFSPALSFGAIGAVAVTVFYKVLVLVTGKEKRNNSDMQLLMRDITAIQFLGANRGHLKKNQVISIVVGLLRNDEKSGQRLMEELARTTESGNVQEETSE